MALSNTADPQGVEHPAMVLGDEQYLWILVVLEVALLFLLRGSFRRTHGG